MKKLLTTLFLVSLLTSIFLVNDAIAAQDCPLSGLSPEAKNFDCQQDRGRLSFVVEFNEPENFSGTISLYDGNNRLGYVNLGGGDVGASAQISNGACLDCGPQKVQIRANFYGQVSAGRKKLTLRYGDDCSVNFNTTVPECKGTISITKKSAKCVAQGDRFLTTNNAAANTTENKVANVSMTIQAEGSSRYTPRVFSVYYRKGGRDIRIGTAYPVRGGSSRGRKYEFSDNLPTSVSGRTTFTVVESRRATPSRNSSTLNPDDYFYFAKTTINIPKCGDSDGDGTSDQRDKCPNDRNKTDPGICGCGTPDTDSDGDGKPDCIDNGDDRIDTDGDGIPDYKDFCDNTIDSDGDGTSDCNDECPNDPAKTIKDDCGCGTPPQIDSDGDGIVNCMDPCPYDLNQYVDGQLECGRTIESDTRLGDRITANYGDCSNFSFEGKELFYKFTLYDAGAMTVRFKEIGSGSRQLQLIVLNNYCFVESCIGTIAGNPGKEEALVLENLEAGDYYFAVDSRSLYDRAEFELTVDCGVGIGGGSSVVSCAENALLSEDFEGFAEGSDIVEASGAFELFGESSVSANVVTTEGETPNKAIYFDRSEGASDIAFVVGNQHSGIARVAWNMFVQPNKGATFNIFGHESTVSFGAKYQIDTDDTDLQGKWMAVEVYIDLDNDEYTMYLDNRAEVVTGDYLMGVARVNFYAYWNNAFFVDNLCYSMVESVPSASRVASVENAMLAEIVKPTAATTTRTNEVSFETNITTTTAATFGNDLTVYPNPTTGVLNVNLSLGKESSMTLELLDPMGRIVRSINTAKTNLINEQLTISDLSNGLYILRAYNKEVVWTKRIVKQ